MIGAAPGRLSDSYYANHERIRILGRGQSGAAVLLKHPITGHLVVAKECSTPPTTTTTAAAAAAAHANDDEHATNHAPQTSSSIAPAVAAIIQNEVAILKRLDHRRIIAYIDCFISDDDSLVSIVMEYAPGGTLANAIAAQQTIATPFATSTVFRWLSELTSALSYVHSRRILHRDIKTANVFLTADACQHVKLGDFGVSRAFSTETNLAETMCGTPYYLSPELIRGQPYAEPADVWALGVILFELLALRRPFSAPNGALGALVMRITQGDSEVAPLRACAHPWWLICLVDRELPGEPKLPPTAAPRLLDLDAARRLTLESLRYGLARCACAVRTLQRAHRRRVASRAAAAADATSRAALRAGSPAHDEFDAASRPPRSSLLNGLRTPSLKAFSPFRGAARGTSAIGSRSRGDSGSSRTPPAQPQPAPRTSPSAARAEAGPPVDAAAAAAATATSPDAGSEPAPQRGHRRTFSGGGFVPLGSPPKPVAIPRSNFPGGFASKAPKPPSTSASWSGGGVAAASAAAPERLPRSAEPEAPRGVAAEAAPPAGFASIASKPPPTPISVGDGAPATKLATDRRGERRAPSKSAAPWFTVEEDSRLPMQAAPENSLHIKGSAPSMPFAAAQGPSSTSDEHSRRQSVSSSAAGSSGAGSPARASAPSALRNAGSPVLDAPSPPPPVEALTPAGVPFQRRSSVPMFFSVEEADSPTRMLITKEVEQMN